MGKKKLSEYRILLLKSNFSGGFLAFDEFVNVIEDCCNKYNIKCFISNTVQSAIDILEKEKIDFSISIGEYKYLDENGTKLYDRFKIHNYLWVMDNPYKLNLDTKSMYNHLITIDKEFLTMLGINRSDYLSLPMVFPSSTYKNSNRINAIFVPMKINSLNFIKEKIENDIDKDNINLFIENFNYDKSYIIQFKSFLESHVVNNNQSFFRLTNSYIKAKKRIMVLNSIKHFDLYLLSKDLINEIDNPKVHYIPDCNFKETCELMKKYKYVLSASPNYDFALHERMSYAIKMGAILLCDNISIAQELNMPGTYSYSELNQIDNIIINLNDNVVDSQVESLNKYEFEKIINEIIKNYERITNEL